MKQYIFHVVGLPHTQTNGKYNCCAYTGKVIRFCKMMMDQGHTVHLYGAGRNTVRCTSFTRVYPARWRPGSYLDVPFDPTAEHWVTMNRNVIDAIRVKKSPQDFICVIAGRCQADIAAAFPDLMTVEFGVGYGGIFSKFRVFESYAWMHMVYGAMSRTDPGNVDGSFFDTVIPNSYDPDAFRIGKLGDYYLYLGRLTDRKGWRIAQQVCEKINARLLVAGPGEFSGYGEYLGILDDVQKAKYLSRALGVFCPSLYVEPFCGVMAESGLSGVPVIATPWGSFSENILEGETGFLCHSMREFIAAAEKAPTLNRQTIRDISILKFGWEWATIKYSNYFDHLYTLWSNGWYA